MRYLILITFLFLASCKTKETHTATSTHDSIYEQPPLDEYAPFVPSDSTYSSDLDSTFYIGYIEFFPETREFYLLLSYTKDDFFPKLDSIVYFKDEDFKRHRVANESLKAFPLAGLANITVYDEQNRPITKAKLESIEQFDDAISSQYIAVYKQTFTPKGGLHYYGVGENATGYQRDFSYTEFNDAALTKTLLAKLNKDTLKTWTVKHYRIQPANIVYSVLTREKESLITEFNGEIKILMYDDDNFNFEKILPLPFQKNDKPLMLISAAVPESDVFWEGLVGYQDGKYVVNALNRVKLK